MGSGIHAEKVSGSVIITDNQCYFNGQKASPSYGSGIVGADVTELTANNNHCDYNMKFGGWFYGSITSISSVNINNSYFCNNSGGGAYISYAKITRQLLSL